MLLLNLHVSTDIVKIMCMSPHHAENESPNNAKTIQGLGFAKIERPVRHPLLRSYSSSNQRKARQERNKVPRHFSDYIINNHLIADKFL